MKSTIVVLLFFFTSTSCTSLANLGFDIGNNLKFGPYQTTVVRTGKCETPPMPYEKNPAYIYYCESYESEEKTLLRANFTVVRTNPHLKECFDDADEKSIGKSTFYVQQEKPCQSLTKNINVKAFIKEEDRWKIMYMNKNVGCRRFLTKSLKIVFNIQGSELCIPKGTYTYKDLDFNDVQHIWLKTFMYGKFLWTLQMMTNAGTNVCWQYETDITPVLE